jgi:hypothetical protein
MRPKRHPTIDKHKSIDLSLRLPILKIHLIHQKGVRHRFAEEMATTRTGLARITEWLSAWLSKSEGGHTAYS